jgi:hypothetical protein
MADLRAQLIKPGLDKKSGSLTARTPNALGRFP